MLETICQYLYYNLKYRNAKQVPDMELPIPQLLQLLVMSDYLHGSSEVLAGIRWYHRADSGPPV